MTRSKWVITKIIVLYAALLTAQEKPDSRAEIILLEKEIAFHSEQLDTLKTQLLNLREANKELSPWSFRIGGIFGMDFNRFTNWAGRGDFPNSSSSSFSTSIKTRANFNGTHFFWRNNGKVSAAWKKIDVGEKESSDFYKTADILKINTHFGLKMNEKLAVSVLGEWKSSLFDQSLTPSYMDWSIGLTWTPNEAFFAVMHPFNYELALSDRERFESSLGARIVMEYDKDLSENLEVKSNVSGFMSYEEFDFLTNFTWTNGLNIKLLKSMGLGFEYALRVSPQETAAIAATEDVQSYFIMGISYVLP